MTDCSCLVDTVKNYREEVTENMPDLEENQQFLHEYVPGTAVFQELGLEEKDFWPYIGCLVGKKVLEYIIFQKFLILALQTAFI